MTAQRPEPRASTGLSLRLRLTLWTVAIFVAIKIALVSLLLIQQWRSITETQDLALGTAAQEMRRRVIEASPYWRLEHLRAESSDYIFVGIIDAAVLSTDGDVLARSNEEADFGADNAMRPFLDFDATEAFRMTSVRVPQEGGKGVLTYRARIEPFHGADGNPYMMMVYADRAQMSSFYNAVLRVVLQVSPIGILAAAIGAWVLAGIAVRPLMELRRAAQKISPQTLDEHIDLQSPFPEVAGLAHELDGAMQRLESGFDDQSRFISNVSHELRTPISVLLTEAETLKMREKLSPEVSEFVESVAVEMKRLGRLIESLYILSRVRDRAVEPSETVSNMNDVLLGAINSCRALALEHGVRIRPVLADQDEEPLVKGDPALLGIMIANPIRNAVRFSERGQIVIVRGDLLEGRLRITVRDHGPGMPESHMPTTLESYLHARDDRRSGHGMGLGLTITRSIAALHSGSVEISNHPAGGCCVVVELPSIDPDRAEDGVETGDGADETRKEETAPPQ